MFVSVVCQNNLTQQDALAVLLDIGLGPWTQEGLISSNVLENGLEEFEREDETNGENNVPSKVLKRVRTNLMRLGWVDSNEVTVICAAGLVYLNGIKGIVKSDHALASRMIEKVARSGNAFAAYIFGHCCEFGIAMDEPNLEQARSWYEKSATKKNLLALFALGKFYYNIDKDMDRARECFEKSTKLPMSLHGLGVLQLRANEPELAFSCFNKAGELGFGLSNYFCGACLNFGIGCDKSHVKAVKLVEKAAENGSPHGEMEISMIFYQQRRYRDAHTWMKRIVDQNMGHPFHAEAATLLGFMMLNGHGVPRNAELAKFYFKKAASRNAQDIYGKLCLGKMFLDKNMKSNARAQFSKIPSQHPMSLYLLGELALMDEEKIQAAENFKSVKSLECPDDLFCREFAKTFDLENVCEKAQAKLVELGFEELEKKETSSSSSSLSPSPPMAKDSILEKGDTMLPLKIIMGGALVTGFGVMLMYLSRKKF